MHRPRRSAVDAGRAHGGPEQQQHGEGETGEPGQGDELFISSKPGVRAASVRTRLGL